MNGKLTGMNWQSSPTRRLNEILLGRGKTGPAKDYV